jgi:hypothetical protein
MKKEKLRLSIELNGRIYKGYRIITRTDNGKINQLIRYRTFHKRKDVYNYKPGQEKMMENVAKLIMKDLVREVKGLRKE